jgi:hypothetical protein
MDQVRSPHDTTECIQPFKSRISFKWCIRIRFLCSVQVITVAPLDTECNRAYDRVGRTSGGPGNRSCPRGHKLRMFSWYSSVRPNTCQYNTLNFTTTTTTHIVLNALIWKWRGGVEYNSLQQPWETESKEKGARWLETVTGGGGGRRGEADDRANN